MTESDKERFLVPAPADCVAFGTSSAGKLRLQPLAPLTLAAGELTSFSDTADASKNLGDLLPVGYAESSQKSSDLGQEKETGISKPSKDAPDFWYWDKFEAWLKNPAAKRYLSVNGGWRS